MLQASDPIQQRARITGALFALQFLLLALAPQTAHALAVFDDLDSAQGWVGPIYSYGFTDSGTASLNGGFLTVRHEPKYKWHTVSMRKVYSLDFQPETWVHMRFKLAERLLGADMYTTIKLDDRAILGMGINGEQLWHQGQQCVAKSADDELFLGSDVIAGESSGKRSDMRVGLDPAVIGQVHYDTWNILSLKFDASGQARRIRFFVNGREIVYRDIDNVYPEGAIDNRFLDGYQPTYGNNTLSIELANFTDGDLYGDTSVNNGWGVRWLHAFADMTPAIPHPTMPTLAVKKASDMLWDVLIISSREGQAALKPHVLDMIFGGRIATGAAIFMDMIRWQDAEVNVPWMSPQEIEEIRVHPLGSPDFGLPPNGSIVINAGAEKTVLPRVTLTLNAEDKGIGMGQMRLSNDGAAWSDWEPYVTRKLWPLSPGAGTKEVFVQFRDAANLPSPSYHDAIVFEPALRSGVRNGGRYQ